MYTDSHAHLTSEPIFGALDEILQRAKERQVERIFNICTDKVSLRRGLELAAREERIHSVGATPPQTVEQQGELYFPLFEAAAKEGKLVAIGETGLDYHHRQSPKEIQRTFLIRYLRLAAKCLLPVVIHCRDAFADLYAIAGDHFPEGQIVLHCFTGTMNDAERALEKGWMLSFSGIVTFKRSEELRAIAREVPIDRMLIETDSPYLAPQSMRGQTNEPSFIHETAQTIAAVKGLAVEEAARITSGNARRFFKLEP
ncbi:MAG: TatD family hydrolase [Chlamydiota bacterium]